MYTNTGSDLVVYIKAIGRRAIESAKSAAEEFFF